jgi:hypothetical protein
MQRAVMPWRNEWPPISSFVRVAYHIVAALDTTAPAVERYLANIAVGGGIDLSLRS